MEGNETLNKQEFQVLHPALVPGKPYTPAFLRKEAVIPEPEGLSGSIADEKEQNALSGKKVLLVEDNKISQFVIRRYLKEGGLAVKTACNGREAVEMAGKEQFDLVITDLRMPEMDGYEASKRIRDINLCYQQLPIVALTAFNPTQVKELTKKAGITECLLKPFKPEKLYALINKILEEQQEVILLNPLRQRLETTVEGDQAFKDELMRLFLRSFRGLLEELKDGRLLQYDYLNKTRHKHKTTFYMLQLKEYEAELKSLQDKLENAHPDAPEIKQSVLVLSGLSELIIRELEDFCY